MPQVALFGRPNVGKSALFNALVGEDVSLVFDRPGVTRDVIARDVVWAGHKLTLIDTGGLGQDSNSSLDQAVYREAQMAAEAADLVLWVLDAQEGLMPGDLDLAAWLRKHRTRVVHVVNKVDSQARESLLADFAKLGVEKLIPVSAVHRRGLKELQRQILRALDLSSPHGNKTSGLSINDVQTTPDFVQGESVSHQIARLAIVGRPNVGKSSLINLMLGRRRNIVTDIAGTTRDAVELSFKGDLGLPSGISAAIIDTAGMRTRSRITDALERYMTARTVHAINRSHIVLHVVEAQSGATVQDKKIAGLIHKAHRACILVVNKWDLTHKSLGEDPQKKFQEQYSLALREALFFENHVPIVFLSALEKTGLQELFKTIAQVVRNLTTDIPTGPLNRIIQEHWASSPPPLHGQKRFKILYASARRNFPRREKDALDAKKQAAAAGEKFEASPLLALQAPRIVAFCNWRELLDQNWLNALEKKIRAAFPLEGVPLRWEFRDRTSQSEKEST